MDPVSFKDPPTDKGWQRIDGGIIFGPVTETITPATGTGTLTTILDTNRAYRITFFLEYTGDQALTVNVLVGYATTSNGTVLSKTFPTAKSQAIPAGNVTEQTMFVTLENAVPFTQVQAISAGALGTGNLKVTAYASSHMS